jgi:hypothetical protein
MNLICSLDSRLKFILQQNYYLLKLELLLLWYLVQYLKYYALYGFNDSYMKGTKRKNYLLLLVKTEKLNKHYLTY